MSHSHGHCHQPAAFNRLFAWGIGLNTVYILAEVYFGITGNSLALLADAGHNLSDVLGLMIAWIGHLVSQWPSRGRRTYGYGSTSIWAALLNALLLLLAVGGIAWEAVGRLQRPVETTGTTMMWVAGLGVIVNAATALLFFRGREHDLNLRGAFLHMAADAVVSLGVVVSGLMIVLTEQMWIDPAISLLVAVVILLGTWGLLRESVNLMLHGVPAEIDLPEVRQALLDFAEVENVHDLHVWAMSTTRTALTAHVVCPQVEDADALLKSMATRMHDCFEIEHVTIQIERSQAAIDCAQRCAEHGEQSPAEA